MIETNKIICGAMPKATKVFPDGYFNCCISSPPYWALRDYGVAPRVWDGDKNCEHTWTSSISKKQTGGLTKKQITNVGSYFDSSSQFCSRCGAWRGTLGLEPTFELYIEHLCTIYDDVKRVLRADGTCWVNLGDTYNTHQAGNKVPCGLQQKTPEERAAKQKFERFTGSLPEKCLCLIPQRFAIEMVNRGWILRNVIIWHKPNPMPSSAKDRFTVDFEYVYFFVKSKKYWFEPQYEPTIEPYSEKRAKRPQTSKMKAPYINGGTAGDYTYNKLSPLGRNKRTVWTIPTQSFPGAHFATFPEKLVEPMIKAGCSEFVCTKCGKAREVIYEPSPEYAKKLGTWTEDTDKDPQLRADIGFAANTKKHSCIADYIKKGYTDCGCNAEWRPGIVLDCFCRQLYHRQGRRQAA